MASRVSRTCCSMEQFLQVSDTASLGIPTRVKDRLCRSSLLSEYHNFPYAHALSRMYRHRPHHHRQRHMYPRVDKVTVAPYRLRVPSVLHRPSPVTSRRAFTRSSGAALGSAVRAHPRSSRGSSAPSTMSPPRTHHLFSPVRSPSPPLAIALSHVAPSIHAKQ